MQCSMFIEALNVESLSVSIVTATEVATFFVACCRGLMLKRSFHLPYH